MLKCISLLSKTPAGRKLFFHGEAEYFLFTPQSPSNTPLNIMSWTAVFPVLTEAQVAEYEIHATPDERAEVAAWTEVARVINPQQGKHLIATSLFWKPAQAAENDFPRPTREVLRDAAKLGWVSRHAPCRGHWADVQCLTAGYATGSDIPPANLRILDDDEWLGCHPLCTELCSAATLDMLGWQDDGGRSGWGAEGWGWEGWRCGLAVWVALRQAGSPPSKTARMAILRADYPADRSRRSLAERTAERMRGDLRWWKKEKN